MHISIMRQELSDFFTRANSSAFEEKLLFAIDVLNGVCRKEFDELYLRNADGEAVIKRVSKSILCQTSNAVQVSTSTILRFCNKNNFCGYSEFKEALKKEITLDNFAKVDSGELVILNTQHFFFLNWLIASISLS